jgi:hypothetical protein
MQRLKEKELYALCVQETYYIQDFKDGMKCMHHGPTKQTCRRGSGGAMVQSKRSSRLDKRGQEAVRVDVCIRGTKRLILVKLNLIRSKSNCKTNHQLASAYFPDSRKAQDELLEYPDNVENTVKSVPNMTLLLLDLT